MDLPRNPLESFKRRNPHLYGRPLASLENPERQPDQRGQGQDCGLEGSPQRPRFCVVILSLRHRLIDAHDNLRTGAKPLVDRITERLGFQDDADPRLTWEYGQVLTNGPEGTLVLISSQF